MFIIKSIALRFSFLCFFLVFLAISPICQIWASRFRTWFLWFYWHLYHLLSMKKEPFSGSSHFFQSSLQPYCPLSFSYCRKIIKAPVSFPDAFKRQFCLIPYYHIKIEHIERVYAPFKNLLCIILTLSAVLFPPKCAATCSHV